MPPLGLAYLAGALSTEEIASEIWDLQLHPWTNRRLEEKSVKSSSPLYGITANIFTLRSAMDSAGIIKRCRPDSTIVLGGPCTVFPPSPILHRFPQVDIMALGEGERTIIELGRSLPEGSGLDEIQGIAFRREGKIVVNLQAAPLPMDDLPRPSRVLIHNPRYRMHPPFNIYPPLTTMETSRGCPYRCQFCTIDRTLRIRSVGSLVEELDELIRFFGYREIHFVDPTFTSDPERILSLCEEIKQRGLDFYWTCKTRPDLVSEEVLRSMARSGCYMISYGFESGDQKILDHLNKNMTVKQILSAILLTHKHNMRTLAYILLGSPGETDETVEASIDLVHRNHVDFTLFGELLPDPASELTLEAIQRGAFTAKAVEAFFLDGDPGPFAERTLSGIERATMKKWLLHANRRFYFRPSYLLRRLLTLRNPRDLVNLLIGGLMVVMERFRKDRDEMFIRM